MFKSFIVDTACNNMRIDRWIRNKIGKIPQSLIEKSLRSGKIKINKKKLKALIKSKQKMKLSFLILILKKELIKKKSNSTHPMR